MGWNDTLCGIANVGFPLFYFNLCGFLEYQTYLPSSRIT